MEENIQILFMDSLLAEGGIWKYIYIYMHDYVSKGAFSGGTSCAVPSMALFPHW